MPQYLLLCIATLLMWGTYTLFGNVATKIQGEKITMAFEALGMMAVAAIALASAKSDFCRVTSRSIVFAAIMGLLSAGGLYLQLRAIRLEPGKVGTISLITGLWPVITIFAAALTGQQPLTAKNMIGALVALAGMVIVSI